MGYSASQRSVFFVVLAAIAAGTAFATVSVAGVARSDTTRGDPVVFLKGVVRQIAGNRYASAWQTLAPAQQRLVPKSEYVRCESSSPVPGRLDWIKVVRAYDEPVEVAGLAGLVTSKAVTFQLKIVEPALQDSVVLTHTVHAVPAGSHWAWILPPDRFQLHRSGTCGAMPVGAP
jgi:hypothetical protein